MLFNNDEVKVKHDGSVYTLKKSETYGYRDTKGKEVRFVDNKEYKILNPRESLLIYYYDHLAHPPKAAAQFPVMYFFTNDVAAAPQPLTKANLKAAFPENHKLHDAIDAQFGSDMELYDYDSFHKMYKLNWIIKNNIK